MRANYHTHNYRCIHADGTVAEYVEAAIKAGLDEIGISDHMPHPGKDIDNGNRMKYEELQGYFNDIDEEIKKHGHEISIKNGIECEYFRDYGWLYEELQEKYKVDYLILGAHFFPYEGEFVYVGDVELTPEVLDMYVDYVIESMETGLFVYLAHPDLWGRRYLNWDEHTEIASRRIIEKAVELDMPLEINVNGLRKPTFTYNNGTRYQYPHNDFWKVAKEYDVKIIVGIDAHYPKEVKDLDMGINYANELGLKVVEKLEL